MTGIPDPLFAILIACALAALGLLLFLPERACCHAGNVPPDDRASRIDGGCLKHLHRSETHERHPTLQSLAGFLNVTASQAARSWVIKCPRLVKPRATNSV
jgi:hypothetical protein